MRIYKIANKMGRCLRESLKVIKKHPDWKLMMGDGGRNCDTAHFWVEDKEGNIHDNASDSAGDNYEYIGREVDPVSATRVFSGKRIKILLKKWRK